MDPKLTHDKIINNAKQRKDNIKGHIHHIIPRCLGGTDDHENLVKLTYKEHYFIHYLLTKIYVNNYKILLAYMFMSRNGKYGDKIISMRTYERACELHSKYMSEHSIGFPWDDPEFKNKMSKILRETLTNTNKNPKNIIKANKNKCLVYMYKYLCNNSILNPTDEDIKSGYPTHGDGWRKYYDEEEWVTAFRDYIKVNKLVSKKFNKAVYNTVNNSKSRLLNTMRKNLILQRYGKVTCNEDVTDLMIISAKWYNAKRRCWNIQNWRKYYTEEEWILEVRKFLDENPIDNQQLNN